MPLKIVLLIDELTDITGGAERQVYELIKRIDTNTFKITLYVLHHKNIPKEIQALNIPVTGLGIKKIYGSKGIFAGFKFSKQLKKEEIDILMTYHFGSDIWGAIFGKMAGIPVIISCRRDEGFWRKKTHIRAYRITNSWLKKILAVSEGVKRIAIEQEKVRPEKIQVVYNGVDQNKFDTPYDSNAKKTEINLPHNAKIIGCVGNLKPIKGHIFFIEAADMVVRKFPDVHFVLIGEDELAGSLQSKVKSLGIENNFHFLGKRSDIPELLQIMDICVLPSLSEGLSNVLLEYMASGKPVIATNAGGNREVIANDSNGILVAAQDPRAIAKQIIRLLEDKDFADRLGKKAKETIKEKFTIAAQIKRVEEIVIQLSRKKMPQKDTELKIAHLISSSGLYGAEKVMLAICSKMNYNSYTSWVVNVHNSHNPHQEVLDEAQRFRLPTYTLESKGRFDIKTVYALSEFLKEHTIDILHTHNYKANLLGLLAARKAKINTVATIHGYIGNTQKLKLYEIFDRFILRFFNKIVLVDDTLKKWFKNGQGKYTVINNGAQIQENVPVNEASPDKHELVIGTIGRLSPEKGHRYLLEAFSKIQKEFPQARLLIVGDGSLRSDLENLANTLGIREKVTFAGFQRDVYAYYSLIDIYVLPSLIEHFPLTVLEAMSYKKAIVATNTGGTSDLIKDRTTGLLITPGSSEEIYKAISIYLNIPPLRKALGENAWQFVKENYSLEKMVNSYKKTYAEVMKE